MTRYWLGWLWMGCHSPLEMDVDISPFSLDISTNQPISVVEIYDDHERLVLRKSLPEPSRQIWLPLEVRSEQWRVWGQTPTGMNREVVIQNPKLSPVIWTIEAPRGTAARPVEGKQGLVLYPDTAILLVGTATAPVTLEVRIGEQSSHVQWRHRGERQSFSFLFQQQPMTIQLGEQQIQLVLGSRDHQPAPLQFKSIQFPADISGSPDPSRDIDQISLATFRWQKQLEKWGLGSKISDTQIPWAYEAISIENPSELPRTVVIAARVEDDNGKPIAAFRSHIRGEQLNETNVLLHIPANEIATAILPVFIDRANAETDQVTRVIRVLPLGSDRELISAVRSWNVSRGYQGMAMGLMVASVGASLGLFWVGTRARRYLRQWSTTQLAMISVFASLQLAVSAFGQLFASVMTTLLGPFGPLLTGFVDDLPRTILFATLITLFPRPGLPGMAMLVVGMARTLAFGSFTLMDALHILGSVAWLEGICWLVGLLRTANEPNWKRFVRLFAVFGGTTVLQIISVVAVHTAIYQLFYAPWYIVSVLIAPSIVYVGIGCAIAIPFADSLREVRP